MNDFEALAGVTCPGHESLLLALSDALGSPPEPAQAALRRLAGWLPEPAGAAEDLAAVAGLLRSWLRPALDAPLLLGEALAIGRGHPLAVAAAAISAAHRRGLPLGLVGNGDMLWIAHADGDPRLVLDPGWPWGPFDARTLGVDLHWRCSHQLAFLTLERLELRALAEGDRGRARASSSLMARLPVEYRAAAAERP